MKPTVVSKKVKPLPNRAQLSFLEQSRRTINDYAKALPALKDEPVPLIEREYPKRA